MTEQIWRKLSDRLHQFVRSRIDSTTDVDDILQTVFLRIHLRLDDLRDVDRLESWVFQITRNTVMDHYRKRRDLQLDTEVLAKDSDESLGGVNSELASCLGTLIEKLSADQRRALSMYELEGISQKEIAKRESISLSGAKSRVQRGRKSLEAILKACCEFQFDVRGNVIQCERTRMDCCTGKGGS